MLIFCCVGQTTELIKMPYWFDWLSLFANLLFITGGFIVAFAVYSHQRNDNARDAYEAFQDSLLVLNDAVDKTIVELSKFKTGMSASNDDLANPKLPVALNDRFLEKVDLPSLKRYYKKHHLNYSDLMSFLKQSSILGAFYNIFLNEFNSFRTTFFSFEQKFKRHRLLYVNLFHEVRGGLYKSHSVDFERKYTVKIQELMKDVDVVKNSAIINRNLLNERYIVPIAQLAGEYITTDEKASQINQLANEVNDARIDMDNLKASMADSASGYIILFENLKTVIENLLRKSK